MPTACNVRINCPFVDAAATNDRKNDNAQRGRPAHTRREATSAGFMRGLTCRRGLDATQSDWEDSGPAAPTGGGWKSRGCSHPISNCTGLTSGPTLTPAAHSDIGQICWLRKRIMQRPASPRVARKLSHAFRLTRQPNVVPHFARQRRPRNPTEVHSTALNAEPV